MKKGLLTAAILAAVLLTSCDGAIPGMMLRSTGRVVTEEYQLSDFTIVEAHDAFVVQIRRAPEFRVSVSADGAVMPHVRAEVDGSLLRLYLDNGFRGIRAWGTGRVEVDVTMPDLREVRLSGASQGSIDGFTRDLDAELSGASSISGHVAAGSLQLEASGASRVELDGSAQELTVQASGASRLDLANLRAGNAHVSLSGASSAEVDVIGALDYDLSGASRLTYNGNPTIGNADTSGGSSAGHR